MTQDNRVCGRGRPGVRVQAEDTQGGSRGRAWKSGSDQEAAGRVGGSSGLS